MTLPSGTYYAEARCSFRNFNTSNSVTCKARLYNSTDSAVIADGIAQEANYLVTDSQSTETVMEVRAYFTLASSKGIKLRNMFSGATNCSGGAAMSLGTEVYSELMIWKVA